MDTLHDKVVVITGGGGGIGFELGVSFGRRGAKVVLADVIPDPLVAAETKLREQGIDAIAVIADVTDFDSVCALRDRTVEVFGAVHVVCNNAGIGSGAKGTMWEHHLNDWRWSFDVNVFGVINGIKAFVPMLVEQDEGHVVNTSSGNGGFTPMPQNAIYPVTKAAVTTITECLWGQLRFAGSKVGASILFPSSSGGGILNTGIWRPGANRPERYRRGDEPEPQGANTLEAFRAHMRSLGIEMHDASLGAVAEMCLEGVLNNVFWITASSSFQEEQLRARLDSQLAASEPSYLLRNSMDALGKRVGQ
ncbi:MAG: SDR family NAD(P)-dependent oxidoreductase [Actinobacteria bacterium]|nr:MAG: SDR family NAD(P)-dependent oxidoreductase [Actinomycetota bacterium]